MSRIGLVLGGGGVTGASYEMAALMAIEMATGWNPNHADVIVGTSAGAFVGGLVRSERLELSSLVKRADNPGDVAARISEHLFKPLRSTSGMRRWLKHGLVPGIRRPGLRLALGSPGVYDSNAIFGWFEQHVDEAAYSWPDRPLLITSYNLEDKQRVVFGADDGPAGSLGDAVAASSAVPMIFSPYHVNDNHYVDGGVLSGTHADLVLGSPDPLDLVLILAPMAADQGRSKATPIETLLDRVGKTALDAELNLIREQWPDTDVVVLRPEPEVLETMRPNPMRPDRAVPSFIRTLSSMSTKLAHSSVWEKLQRHLSADHAA